jgi:hypothetical protein
LGAAGRRPLFYGIAILIGAGCGLIAGSNLATQ